MKKNVENITKFIIWGTGHYSKLIMNHFEQISNEFSEFRYVIDAFIDTDKDKQIKAFCGKNVYTPEYIDKIDDQIIIISMFKYQEVENYLRNKGINNYFTSYEVLTNECFVQELMCSEDITENTDASSLIFRNLVRRQMRKNQIAHINFEQNVPYIFRLSAVLSECGEDINRAEKYIVDIGSKEIRQIKANSSQPTVGIYYSRLYSGGVERVISRLIPLILNKGFKVVLFTHSINEMDYDVPDDIERCVIHYDPLMPYLWLEQFYEELTKRNIGVLINHAHAAWRSYYLGFCTKQLGVRYLVESHTCKAAIMAKNAMFFKKIYSLADKLVVLSRADEEYWVNNGLSARYIPNPIEMPNMKIGCNYNNREMIWVGRIDVGEKNVYDIVSVTKNVAISLPDIKLYVIGGADDESVLSELKRRIVVNGLEDNIEIVGYQKDLHNFYMDAGVMICTSPYEGFPMALAEGMSYGLPVVMYDIEGLELTRDKRGVVCVPQRDSAALADNVVKILENERLRGELSHEALQTIMEIAKTDISTMWQEIITE